ncbi:hypothetical protein ACJD0Z_02055 [Flavobacteriaceae bacterium M23B6Z8]
MKHKSKRFLLFCLAFVVTFLLVCYTVELVRIYRAESLGYTPIYNETVARTEFLIESDVKRFEELVILYKDRSEYLESDMDFQQIRSKNLRANALIELSGLLWAACITIIGLILFFKKTSHIGLTFYNWLGLFLSFFFIRHFVVNTFDLIFDFKWCAETDMLLYYNLPLKLSMIIFELVGILLLGTILVHLPKKYKMSIVLAALVAGAIALFLWVKYAGIFLS